MKCTVYFWEISSVFDTSVAKTHLAGQTPFEFKPQGFDVFPELVRAFSCIESRLDSDIETRTKENKFIKSFVGDESIVSSAIAILSADTNLGELRELAVYGESEQARLDEIDRQIKELQTKSAADALKSLEEAKTNITSLDNKLKDLRWHFTADKQQEYQEKLDNFKRKTRETKNLGSESFKVPIFKSVGSDEWQHLIEAAKNLGALESEEYPQEQDHCLLCHRPLDVPSLALPEDHGKS